MLTSIIEKSMPLKLKKVFHQGRLIMTTGKTLAIVSVPLVESFMIPVNDFTFRPVNRKSNPSQAGESSASALTRGAGKNRH
jgi:hypothetical protein